eukprot:4053546-Amphidinium_carterae.1
MFFTSPMGYDSSQSVPRDLEVLGTCLRCNLWSEQTLGMEVDLAIVHCFLCGASNLRCARVTAIQCSCGVDDVLRPEP